MKPLEGRINDTTTTAALIKVRYSINVQVGQHIKINKRPVLNKGVRDGQISRKNKSPVTL